MGIAKDPLPEQRHVLTQLGFGVEPATGVIQVDVPLPVQPPILGDSQFVQLPGGFKGWVGSPEGCESCIHRIQTKLEARIRYAR